MNSGEAQAANTEAATVNTAITAYEAADSLTTCSGTVGGGSDIGTVPNSVGGYIAGGQANSPGSLHDCRRPNQRRDNCWDNRKQMVRSSLSHRWYRMALVKNYIWGWLLLNLADTVTSLVVPEGNPLIRQLSPVSFVIYKVCVTAVVTAAIYLKGDNSHFSWWRVMLALNWCWVGIVIWNMFCIFTWHA